MAEAQTCKRPEWAKLAIEQAWEKVRQSREKRCQA